MHAVLSVQAREAYGRKLRTLDIGLAAAAGPWGPSPIHCVILIANPVCVAVEVDYYDTSAATNKYTSIVANAL